MSAIDYILDKPASRVLARKIEAFWHNKGYYKVRAWVESQRLSDVLDIYVIRSNMRFNITL